MTGAARVYAQDWKSPTSFGIWGGFPGDRAKLARAVAHRVDPDLIWLQIENPEDTRDPIEGSIVDMVPPDRLYVVHPPDFAPQTGLGNLATWFVREDLDANARLQALADFMRLPNLARSILEGRSIYSPTLALVIANSDRLQSLYPTEEGGIRPFIRAVNEYATTLLFTLTTPPLANARDVDYLLHIERQDSEGHSVVNVSCTQGAPPGTAGLFALGQRWTLGDLLEQIGHA